MFLKRGFYTAQIRITREKTSFPVKAHPSLRYHFVSRDGRFLQREKKTTRNGHAGMGGKNWPFVTIKKREEKDRYLTVNI